MEGKGQTKSRIHVPHHMNNVDIQLMKLSRDLNS